MFHAALPSKQGSFSRIELSCLATANGFRGQLFNPYVPEGVDGLSLLQLERLLASNVMDKVLHRAVNAYSCRYNGRVLITAARLLSERKLTYHDIYCARYAVATYENEADHEGIDLEPTLQGVLRAVKLCGKAISRSAAIEHIKRITLQLKLPHRLQLDEFLQLLSHCENLDDVPLEENNPSGKDERRLYSMCDFRELLLTDDERRQRALETRHRAATAGSVRPPPPTIATAAAAADAAASYELPRRPGAAVGTRTLPSADVSEVSSSVLVLQATKKKQHDFAGLKSAVRASEQLLIKARAGRMPARDDEEIAPSNRIGRAASAPVGSRLARRGTPPLSIKGGAAALEKRAFTSTRFARAASGADAAETSYAAVVDDDDVAVTSSMLEDLRWEVKAPPSIRARSADRPPNPRPSRPMSGLTIGTPLPTVAEQSGLDKYRSSLLEGDLIGADSPVPPPPRRNPSISASDDDGDPLVPSSPARRRSSTQLLTRNWKKPGAWQ